MIIVYEQIFHSWNATYREGKQKHFNYKLENHIERWAYNKQTKTKNGTVPWVVPTFSCKWLQFPKVCVIFIWTSTNILQFIYASHHQGAARKKWLRISTFWHSIIIFLFYLHFSCDCLRGWAMSQDKNMLMCWTIQIYKNDVTSHINDATHTRSQKSCGQGDSGA